MISELDSTIKWESNENLSQIQYHVNTLLIKYILDTIKFQSILHQTSNWRTWIWMSNEPKKHFLWQENSSTQSSWQTNEIWTKRKLEVWQLDKQLDKYEFYIIYWQFQVCIESRESIIQEPKMVSNHHTSHWSNSYISTISIRENEIIWYRVIKLFNL